MSPNFPYRFIAFEGVDGSGKSTQVRLLADRLRALGLPVVTTREPGATSAGRRIRKAILKSRVPMSPLAELFAFCADRAEHVAQIIRPALDAGGIVITDRYELSTWAYQGVAGGLGPDLVERMNDVATGGLHADITIVLDLDPAAGLARNRAKAPDLDPDAMLARNRTMTLDLAADLARNRRDGTSRMESRNLAFHQRVREAYLAWAADHPDACLVIDASEPAEAVHRRIASALGLPLEA